MVDDGLLPAACDLDWLIDTASVLGQAEIYLLLTKTTGWDIATYETSLATTWVAPR
ncbi:MAG: hypothetical protein M3Q48_00450 [Actinomycetota bacterium]|nr:hypothetical protein [Actinomycetota bacterium]